MNAPFPAWADADFSAALEQIAAAGEHQGVEFKRAFPDQARDLAKEMAAFATSCDGTIYLGITDEGEIVGIADGADKTVRADLRSRIEGACANLVAPAITPMLRFGVSVGKVVAAIHVPKGSDPVYYAANVPYLRQLTSARPMKPAEIVEYILNWDAARSEVNPVRNFVADLDMYLIETELDVHDYRMREVNPWRKEARTALPYRAEQARSLAASAPQDAIAAIPLLEHLAEALETVGAIQPHANSSLAEGEAALDEAETTLETLRARWIPTEYFGAAFVRAQRDKVHATAKQLAGLVARVNADPERFSLETLQRETKQRGGELLNLAFARAGMGDADSQKRLKELGGFLRLMETCRMPSDGGQSFRQMVDDIRETDISL